MKRNLLRAPLIKSAGIIGVVSLLVYLTATSPEGSLWSSIGTLTMATFRLVQLALGLIVALVFCLAVLTGIFLACMAIISRESAANMLEGLRQELSDKLLYVRSLVIRDHPSSGKQVLHKYGTELKREIRSDMDSSLDSMRNNHAAATGYMEKMKEQLERIEMNGKDIQLLADRLEKQDVRLQDLVASFSGMNEQVMQVQARVDELTAAVKSDDAGPALKALGQRIDMIEQNSSNLQDGLTEIRELVASVEEEVQDNSRPENETDKPRLFVHLTHEAQQKKIEELVTETLDSDMSYSQVIDHLVKNTSGKAKEILTAHPSLTKDYIRFRRKNG